MSHTELRGQRQYNFSIFRDWMCEFDLKCIELVLCRSCFRRSKDNTGFRYDACYSCKTHSCACVYCVSLKHRWHWRSPKIVLSSHFPITSWLHWTWIFTCILNEDLESYWISCQVSGKEIRVGWFLENSFYFNLIIWVERAIKRGIGNNYVAI